MIIIKAWNDKIVSQDCKQLWRWKSQELIGSPFELNGKLAFSCVIATLIQIRALKVS
jgi:hypothetical protein